MSLNILIQVVLFILLVSLTTYYVMPKFNSFTKALILSILIPYFWMLVILIAVFGSRLIKQIEVYKDSTLIIWSFIKESVFFVYLGFGVWVVSLIIFIIWVAKKQSNKAG